MIRLKYGNTNTYFVNGLLIDTDYAGTVRGFYRALKENGLRMEDIKYVLATLKVLDESECAQVWWDGLDQTHRQIIMDLPNFDAEIFRKCTGIKI